MTLPSIQNQPFRVLVAGGQRHILHGFRALLNADDFHITIANTPAAAAAAAREHEFDVALVDLDCESDGLAGTTALELIPLLIKDTPSLSVVAVSARGSIDLAIEAVRRGARDFADRPWDDLRIVPRVRAQAELGRSLRRLAVLEAENRRLLSCETSAQPIGTMKVREMEALLVRQAMERHMGNVSRAARTLGLSRSALYRRLDRHRAAHPSSVLVQTKKNRDRQ